MNLYTIIESWDGIMVTWWPEFSWLERQIVVLKVTGSSPVGHPISDKKVSLTPP